jgi:uncharacterized protein YjbI with pentapeptide repeats
MTEEQPCTSIPRHLSAVTEKKINEDGDKFYVFLPNAFIDEAIYIRSYTSLSGCTRESVARITWVTISAAEVKIENLTFKGLIQVTANGNLIANNCTFMPLETGECAIEIFAHSKCTLTNCILTKTSKTALLVRDGSTAEISDCIFKENDHSGLLVLDSSKANVTNCKFTGSRRFSVYIYRKSEANFQGCTFSKMYGKGVFILSECETYFDNCTFEHCKLGGISLAEKSKANVQKCKFRKINMSAVHGIKECIVNVNDSKFTDCTSNGINFEYSNGEVSDCEFSMFRCPVFATFGPNTKPYIHDCRVQNVNAFGAIARDCSTPIFEKLTFLDGSTHCFSVSDFAKASIRNCTISNFKGSAFSTFNGALAIVENSTIGKCVYLTDSMTQGSIVFNSNTFLTKMKVQKRFRGTYTLGTNEIDGRVAIVKDDEVVPSEEEITELPKIEYVDPEPVDLNSLVSQDGFSNINSEPCKCFKCGVKDAEVFCSPCGHSVLCEECSKEEKEKPACPLCSTTVQKFVRCFKSDVCLICLNPNDSIILPCGHVNVCYSCAFKIEGKKCPECREKMSSFRHIFPMSDV